MDPVVEPDRTASTPQAQRLLHNSRLRYHRRCLREDATNPDLTTLERLTLVQGRVARRREIERELEGLKTLGGPSKQGWGGKS